MVEAEVINFRHRTRSTQPGQQSWRKHLEMAVLDYCEAQNVGLQDAVDAVSDFLRDGPVLGQRLSVSELRHRNKNEMQFLISSMKHRRRTRSADENASCDACIGQVLALANLNDMLEVDENEQRIDLSANCLSLANGMRDAFGFGENIHIEVEAEALSVSRDVARNVLLILNEALTNAMKHAFGEDGGTVRIKLARTSAGEVELVVADDGCAVASSSAGGSGGSLIDALASQIDGRVHRSRTDSGFRLSLNFLV